MSYVDASYYKTTFKGVAVPDAELDTYLARASESIDMLTSYRITAAGGLPKLTVFQQNMVKNAVCYQAEHLYAYGDMPSPNMAGYNINGVSVSFGSNVDMRYSRDALDRVKSANLMYRRL